MAKGITEKDDVARATQLPIPRFVQHLNAYAVARGAAVSMRVAPYDDDPALRLWSTWTMTVERFYQLEIISPSNRLQKTRKFYTVPSGCNYRPEYALVVGEISASGGVVTWDIDCGPPVFEIEERGGVEVVTYAREIVHFGTVEALMACGIEPCRLPTGKYDAKHDNGGFGCELHAWMSRRVPGNMVLYRIETDLALRDRITKDQEHMRQAALAHRAYVEASAPQRVTEKPEARHWPAYLRLVVDNTRPISNH